MNGDCSVIEITGARMGSGQLPNRGALVRMIPIGDSAWNGPKSNACCDHEGRVFQVSDRCLLGNHIERAAS
jgi:hypothetical protein